MQAPRACPHPPPPTPHPPTPPHPGPPCSGSGLDTGAAGGWEVRPASEMTLEKALDYMG